MQPGSDITPFEVRRIHVALLVCFFLSGATGLVYEVVWTRMAGLVFGNTVYAVTTVLAAFFSGLALGSYLLGPLADRAKRHVHLYGLMEIGIGLYGLCTPLLFGLVETIYLTAYQAGRENLVVFTLFQFLLVFVILVAPTTLMGGTLPVLSRYFVRGEREIGYGVGAIYALNTAGAVVGTLGAGFFLLPVMGVGDTILLTATLNLGIGLLSLAFSRRLPEFEVAGHPPSRPLGYGERVQVGGVPLRLIAVVPLLFAISGGASMVYEIAWTRALALVLGSSVYAFTTMLATFLIGLAGGSYAFSWFFRDRDELGPRSFGWLEIWIGLSSLLILPLFDHLPNLFLQMVGLVNFSFGGLQIVQFVVSFFVMLVPTLLIGATFPCVVKICTPNVHLLGGNIGRLYALNTCGSIFGSFVGGFFLISWMGAQRALTLAAVLNLAIGAILVSVSWMRERAWRARMVAAMACGAIILAVLIPRWDPHLMASGVAIYGQSYLKRQQGLKDFTRRWELLFFKEGLNATISVHQFGKSRILKTNGKTDASNTGDMHTQLMLGHLPLLLHPDPKEALIIGLGSGVTAGAVAQHPVKAVEVVEIEPAVVEAATFFATENENVLEDPRLRVVIGDGRNFLLSTSQTYDVIISEPSNPWIAGVANLFTLEFYQAVKARLAPDGVMCQWIHTYGIRPSDLRMVIKTFQMVFPHTTIWQTGVSDFLLIGTPSPFTVDLGRWGEAASRLGIKDDLRSVGFDSSQAVLADFFLGEEDARLFAQDAALNTDDLPLLEFSAPTGLYLRSVRQNKALAKSYREQEFPPVTGGVPGLLSSAQFRYQLGKVLLAKEDKQEALHHFTLALADNPRHIPSLLLRAELQLQRGLVLQALADLQLALEVEPRNAQALLKMGMIYYRQRILQRAQEYVRKAIAAEEDLAEAHYLLGEVLMAEERGEEAKRAYQRGVELQPHNASFWARLGEVLLTLEDPSQAVETYR
ncbi:MAG: fused MFS/spermidine synthase, partial [Candidatus Methylomirabilales bacterium]